MTEPVDTDALRALAVVLEGHHSWNDEAEAADFLRVAAVEVDRLRAEVEEWKTYAQKQKMSWQVENRSRKDAEDESANWRAAIENAPHAQDCSYRGLILSDGLPLVTDPCTCWKADVL